MQTNKNKPACRIWLVQDIEGQAHWTELSGLWPTKSGSGYSGMIRKSIPVPSGVLTGRLVVMPATQQPGKEG